jgi:iron complex outermembrane recepter protein
LYLSINTREEKTVSLNICYALGEALALTVISVMVTALLLGSMPVHAGQSQKTELNILTQPLPRSLREVAEAFDLQIAFFVDHTKNIDAPSLIGIFSAPEAFDALLKHTALEHIYVSGSSVVVRLRKSDVAERTREPLKGKENSMKKSKPRSLFERFGAAIAGAFISSGASSQAVEGGNADATNMMEEVVVTALKRSQSIGDVPASVSAIGALDLKEKGIADMNDLQFIVPSLHFGGFLGSQNISIRGVGEFNGSPGVAVSLDGIYQAKATSAQLTQLDIERVEVLRGPQGTLYGRNSNGGAVNFVSAAPTFEHESYVKVGYADFDEMKVEGVYSGPITDTTAIRIAANYTDIGEGWVENQTPGGGDLMEGSFTNFRFRLSSELTDSLTADLMYARSEIEGRMDHYAWITDNRELIAFPGGVPQLADAQVTLEPWEQNADFDGDSDRQFDLIGIILDWELSFATLRSITSYQKYQNDKSDDRDSTDLSIYIADEFDETESVSQEFNLSGASDSVDWIVGVFYADDDNERSSFFNFPQPVLGFPVPAALENVRPTYDAKSTAVFVDATWNITDRTRISGGVRRTEDELIDAHTSEFFFFIPDKTSVGVQCDQESDLDWSATTYRASAQYDTSDNSNIYATYSEGYKAGGVVASECSEPYDPEFIDAYEIGYKGSFADGRTSLSASLFYYDYTDFQVAQIIGLASATVNAGDAEVTGAELELSSTLNENWHVNGSVTWLDTEYGDFLNTDGMQPQLGVQQLKGNSLNGSPETSVNFGLAYNTALSSGGSLTLRGDVAYRSRTYFREFNDKDDSQDAYTVVNVNAIWESDDSLWAGRLFAKNLTDEDYIVGLVGSSSNGGRLGSWGPPRQVGVELTRFFGAR